MSLWSRLFGRKPPFIDRREPNDWRPGDLAVCINDDWEPPRADDPKCDDVLRVRNVYEAAAELRTWSVRAFYLQFAERPGPIGWECGGFRKAVEDSAPAEEEFTALIKRPVRKPAPALTPNEAAARDG